MMICNNCFEKITDESVNCMTCGKPMHMDCNTNDMACDECLTKKLAEVKVSDVVLPDVIRRSHIESFKSCPLKFKYEVIDGFEQPPNIYTQLGIDVHELIDKACHDANYTKDKMTEDFYKMWEGYPESFFTDRKIKYQMKERALNTIENIYPVLENMLPMLCTEEKIVFEICPDLPKISTTADRINHCGDGLEIVDWKTGAVMVGKKLSTDLQAPLYIYGAEQHFGKRVERFVFYYLNENKERIFTRTTDDQFECIVRGRTYTISLDDAIRSVKRMFSQMKNGDFRVRGTEGMYFTCKMCHIKQSGMCEGCDIQSWKA